MFIELAAAATLSGDPQLCKAHSARLEALTATLQRRPTDATLYYWEAATWADCKQLASALAALDKVRAHGDGFLPIPPVGFAGIWGAPEFKKLRVALEQALPEVARDAPVAFRIRGDRLVPEGIAYDASSGSLFIGSMLRREILRVRDQQQSVFASASSGLDTVLGLAVDSSAKRLYAVSSNRVFPKPGEAPRNQVIVFDLQSGQLLRTLSADAGQLNDVTIGDGRVFATDSRNGAVYSAHADDASLATLVPRGTLFGANGIALAADGGMLFVAHATGIAKVDTRTSAVQPVVNKTRETVAAIDGLYLYGTTLIGVQNATNPGRVIQIELDQSASEVKNVKTLLSHHHPELDEPTTGALDGDRFLLLANSHIAAVEANGELRKDAKPRSPVILQIAL